MNELGNIYGSLTVIEKADHSIKGGGTIWVVRCICGREYEVPGISLRAGRTKMCRECWKKENDREREWKALKNVWNIQQHGAERRKLDWNIPLDVFVELSLSPCHYCGDEGSNTHSTLKTPVRYNGLDRVDNERGYLVDNVVSCCWSCNRAKGQLTVEEFKAWLTRVFNYLKT